MAAHVAVGSFLTFGHLRKKKMSLVYMFFHRGQLDLKAISLNTELLHLFSR